MNPVSFQKTFYLFYKFPFPNKKLQFLFFLLQIIAVCFLATAAFAAPQGYGGNMQSSPSYGGGSSYQQQSQPATSQSYSGPNQSYQSQPVAYIAPSITFSPPQIQYSQPSITYSSPQTVPVAMPAQQSSYGGSSAPSYNNQQPMVVGYQPSSSGGYSGGSSSSSSYGKK